MLSLEPMEDLLTNYYLKQPEPIQSCLLALRDIILSVNKNISKQRKFQIPFFYYGDKKLAFLWVTRKRIMLGFVEDKNIYPKQKDVRLKDKIDAIYVDPTIDIPIKLIEKKIKVLIKLYDSNRSL